MVVDNLLSDLINHLKSPDHSTLLDILENLLIESKEIKDNHKMLLQCIELKGKILRDLGDYQRSITALKKGRLYCNIGKHFTKKLFLYKIIIETYIQMREYTNAMIFSKKMLRLSWVINNEDYEIIAYDKIGLIYYYEGDL